MCRRFRILAIAFTVTVPIAAFAMFGHRFPTLVVVGLFIYIPMILAISHFLQAKNTDWPQRVREFLAGRKSQTNVDFLSGCSIVPGVDSKKALAVRNVVARLAQIPPEYVRSGDSFADFDTLPFWTDRGDAFFDEFTLKGELERELNLALCESAWERVRNPDMDGDLTINQFVQDLISATSDINVTTQQ